MLLPFKDVEASVSLVLWHLYVFKELQCPSFRELFSEQKMMRNKTREKSTLMGLRGYGNKFVLYFVEADNH